jgi:hypothetical protein
MIPKFYQQHKTHGLHQHIALALVTQAEMPHLLLFVHPATPGAVCFLKSLNLSTDVQPVKFPDAHKSHLSLSLDKSRATSEFAAVGT